MWSAPAMRKPLRLTAQRLHDTALSAWNITHGPVEQDTDERVLYVVDLSYCGSYVFVFLGFEAIAAFRSVALSLL